MLDKIRASRQRRIKPTHLEEIPLLDLSTAKAAATKLLGPVAERLPDWKEHFSVAFHSGREKFGDAYATVARFAASQKEAFEDRLAEKKGRTRAPKKKPAASEPKT